jgi:hypothetical protein
VQDNLRTVEIGSSTNRSFEIKDEQMACFSNCTTVKLHVTFSLTDAGLAKLASVRVLHMSDSRGVSGTGLASLTSLESLSLGAGVRFTSMPHMPKLATLACTGYCIIPSPGLVKR